MKIKSIFTWVLALGMLSSCSKDDADLNGPEITDDTVAYLSITIPTTGTRAPSDENDGVAQESKLESLYLFTFDSNGKIIGVPGSTDYYVYIDATLESDAKKPEARKIAAKATQLLVIANPGAILEPIITGVSSSTTFYALNEAITGAATGEITDDLANITKGFTMINSGSEGSSPAANDVIENPLIDIKNKAVVVEGNKTEAEAKLEAESDGKRVEVKIERLASKLQLGVSSSITKTPSDAQFVFLKWVVDGLNSTFYPFAEKTLLEVGHTSGGYYVKNFYTKDPNFTSNTGIQFAKVDRDNDYLPKFPQGMDWMTEDAKTYCIENTMAAEEQRFGNATRIVIKATYYPASGWTGDWFSFAGKNYETLALLQTAYNESAANSNLRAACNRMYNDIKTYLSTNSNFTADNFAELSEADLALVTNGNGDKIGGEVIKSLKDDVTGELLDCIRWYQDGINYYYNEIRHDDSLDAPNMAFGKYGVVRNNWYDMTLSSVSGPGTPWYPDVDNPGPGDPDPVDPIDDAVGFLGIEVKVAPWIIWNRNIGI